MTTSLVIFIGISVALCALAALAFRSTWKVRGSIFVLAIILLAITYWAVNFFALRLVSLWIFILPVGPIVLILIGLIRRPGLVRKIGVVVVVLGILGYSYLGFAVHTSHAQYAIEGVLHLPTYLKGQRLVRAQLNDPNSAMFRHLSLTQYHGHPYMCGEVNARNRMGGLVGFTRFYVQLDQLVPFPFFDNDMQHDSFNKYMSTCYGDDWDKN